MKTNKTQRRMLANLIARRLHRARPRVQRVIVVTNRRLANRLASQ